MNSSVSDIDAYIAEFPLETQRLLQAMRETIQAAAPAATEKISYGMPTFYLKGNLVHFAAFKNHIGFYSTPSGHSEFEQELSRYKGGKGSVQFPLNEPLPLDLVRRMVEFRANQNLERARAKGKK
ncbi:MAG: DUF1801 domain-containing protein [Bacteroidia bacterium]|nr:DUF1801 domain-containing protein [Bacteroidia bacterium]